MLISLYILLVKTKISDRFFIIHNISLNLREKQPNKTFYNNITLVEK